MCSENTFVWFPLKVGLNWIWFLQREFYLEFQTPNTPRLIELEPFQLFDSVQFGQNIYESIP